MGHFYKYKRGDSVIITSGRYKGVRGVVDSAVFQRTVDYPDEYAPDYQSAWTPASSATRWLCPDYFPPELLDPRPLTGSAKDYLPLRRTS